MKAELSRVKFIAPVTSLPPDIDGTKRHLSMSLDGDVVVVRNSMEGVAVPEIHVPLSNVAFFVVKKAEAKK